jgi:hypothetical protein
MAGKVAPKPRQGHPGREEGEGSVNPLVARVEEMAVRHRPKLFPKRAVEKENPLPGKVLQLPLWADYRRGVPNDLVRGALFTIGNSNTRRPYRQQEVIATLGNIEIIYTGQELRQDDEDVFLQLVHLARLSPLGSFIEFTAHSLLKALRWPTNSRSYHRLRDTIARLNATGLEVRSENRGYSGSLIRDFEWREPDSSSSRTWKVRLEPKIVVLFGHVAYTQIDWDQRLRLGSLGKWLHSFYYTHNNPYPLKIETIHRLCGSTTKSLRKFRQLLRAALEELAEVGFLSAWDVGKTIVQLTRAPNISTIPSASDAD